MCTHTMDPGTAGRLEGEAGRGSRQTEAQSLRPPNIPHSYREHELPKELGVLLLITYCVQAPRARLGL